jgi:hypothetical protein
MYICTLALFFGWFTSVKAHQDSQIVIKLEESISTQNREIRDITIKVLTGIVEDIRETNPQKIIEIFKQRFINVEQKKEDRDTAITMYNVLLNNEKLTISNNIDNIKTIIAIYLKLLGFPKDETREAFHHLPAAEKEIFQKTLKLFKQLDKLKESN